ncbi:hypothetical protein BN2127_JRS3_00549 [Bacillus safensis]|nr:hypothetical protein B4129_3059 [Bacillus safensis]CUB15921.1 hypothetical protein BN2127_JRS3_00549 [Bacillus safensis]
MVREKRRPTKLFLSEFYRVRRHFFEEIVYDVSKDFGEVMRDG